MARTTFGFGHLQFRASLQRRVDAEIVPHHLQWEADGIVAWEVLATSGEHVFLGMSIPEQHGGGVHRPGHQP